MAPRNPQWARDLAKEIQRTARDSADALPRVEVGIVTKIKPEILVRPESGDVLYGQQEVVWGVDRKGVKVGDNVLLARDTSDNPVVVQVLDGNDPDPTRHVKGKALVKTVEKIQQQSRFWKAPIETLAGLNQTTTDADGTVRLVLATDMLYRWKASSDSWVEISGSGGGGASAFSDLTGSLSASQVVDGSIPLTKLSVDPLARANHTGTQLASTISDFSSAVQAISYTEAEVDSLLSSNSSGDRSRANHTGSQLASTISDFTAASQTVGDARYLQLTGGTLSGDLMVSNGTQFARLKAQRIEFFAGLSDVYPTARASSTGFVFGPGGATPADTSFSRTGAGIMGMGVGHKIQQNAAPTVGDDVVNKTYADLKAPLASPALTGIPTAPTAAGGTNTTQLATTAFVTGAIAASTIPDATTAVKGKVLMSVAPAVSTSPTAVGTNDPRVTADQVAGTASIRTLGTGSQQAAPGNHVHGFGSITGTVAAGQYGSGTIVNADINASAAIAQSKIANLTTDLGLKAPLASPGLTGVPTAPTAAPGTSTAQIATTAFTSAAVAALVDAAPGTLDTLNELAAALGDDPNFATTVSTNIGLKANIASPTFTGTPTAPTVAISTNNTSLATTAAVTSALAGYSTTGHTHAFGSITGTLTAGQYGSGSIVNADISASAAIALSKLATNPLDRANHTGTQTASTISDFTSSSQSVGDARYLQLTGGVLSGDFGINKASASTAHLSVKAAAGQGAQISFWEAGAEKWAVGNLSNNEFFVYNDAAASLLLTAGADNVVDFVSTPTAPTAAPGTSTTQIATTAFSEAADAANRRRAFFGL